MPKQQNSSYFSVHPWWLHYSGFFLLLEKKETSAVYRYFHRCFSLRDRHKNKTERDRLTKRQDREGDKKDRETYADRQKERLTKRETTKRQTDSEAQTARHRQSGIDREAQTERYRQRET